LYVAAFEVQGNPITAHMQVTLCNRPIEIVIIRLKALKFKIKFPFFTTSNLIGQKCQNSYLSYHWIIRTLDHSHVTRKWLLQISNAATC